MGFTSGFTGGVTLTLGVAYLTVLAHERNRKAQADALRSQSLVLTSLLEPTPLPPPQTRAELAREERTTLIEAAKDRWNNELENAVRWVQRTDWEGVRVGMEGAVARLLGKGLEKSRDGVEGLEEKTGPRVQEAVDASRAAMKKGAEEAAAGVDRGAAEVTAGASRIATEAKIKADEATAVTRRGLDHAGVKAGELKDATKVKAGELKDTTKANAERASATTKTAAHDAVDTVKHSGGTIDAARGAVRDAFSKGIEKGKEMVGKAQAAVGLAEEKMESRAQSSMISHSSAVEKALHERYEKPDPLTKSAEEVLEERYKPIDERDNTVLRGV